MDLPGPIVYTVWSQEQQYELLKLLAKVINKDYIWGSTFREESWEFVNEQIRRKHPHFTVGRMKAKLRHLKRKYRLFSTLLASRGVQWDRRTNAVCTPEEVWAEYVMAYPLGYQFRNKGIQPRLFDAMRDVFESGVAITDEHC